MFHRQIASLGFTYQCVLSFPKQYVLLAQFPGISSFKHVLLNSKLHLISLTTFDETFSSFQMDWRHSTGSWKINEQYK